VLTRAGIVWLSLSLSIVAAELLFLEESTLIFIESSKALLQMFPFVFAAALYCLKSPQTPFDSLLLHHEFNATCSLMLAAVISYGVSISLFIMGADFAALSVASFTIVFSVSTPSLLSTLWIPLQIARSGQWDETQMIESVTLNRGLFKNRKIGPDGRRAKNLREELGILFRSKLKLNALFFWMTKEFNNEAILAFIEMAQFKEFVIELIQTADPQFFEAEVLRNRFVFHDHVPKSSIVFNQRELAAIALDAVRLEQITEDVELQIDPQINPVERPQSMTINSVINNSPRSPSAGCEGRPRPDVVLGPDDMETIRSRMHQLFLKYICESAPLELNLPWALKNRFCALDAESYRSLGEMDMVMAYDDILREMLSYIEQSYRRLILHLRTEMEEL